MTSSSISLYDTVYHPLSKIPFSSIYYLKNFKFYEQVLKKTSCSVTAVTPVVSARRGERPHPGLQQWPTTLPCSLISVCLVYSMRNTAIYVSATSLSHFFMKDFLNFVFIDLRERKKGREGWREGGRKRERLICCYTYLYIHWFDSCLCPVRGSNPQPWHIRTTL